MLQSLHIKGFKGFKDLQLRDISRVMLVGGKNNVGKTSLLEAIFLFYDTADPGMLFRHLGWRGLDIPLTDVESLFAPIFIGFDIRQKIFFEVTESIHKAKMTIKSDPLPASVEIPGSGEAAAPLKTDTTTATSYRISIRYETLDGTREEVFIVVRQTATNVNIQFEPHPVNIVPADMQHPVIFFPLRLNLNSSEDARRFGQLDINRKTDRVVNFLKILEPQLDGLTSVTFPQNPTIYADIKGMQRKIPVALLGDGMSKLLSVILAVATANNGIVLIDEIDAGVHYSVLPKVWEGIFKAARDFNCQVIATTHNYECLQAALDGASKAGAEDDFSYVRLESHENNVIAKQYTHSVLGAALEQGWEVR
jgi:predicted ATP-dependent endonuclease of OLD family